ncbi:MAG TPA: condensation domain-containing protein, partial [Longimicrobium sp.]|nr:condensation domain-containing protein [Longimicrobium sp.]
MSNRTRAIADLSPAQLAALQARLRALRGEAAVDAGIPRRAGTGPVQLSFAQQRLWFLDQLEPGSAAYNIPFALRMRGPLDAAVLSRSLDEVVRRHETLRTTLPVVDGVPVQMIAPPSPRPIPLVDLGNLPADARDAEARRLARDEALRPFDLARGPLLRATLLRLAADEHVALFTLHHVVADGWSTRVLVREITALYTAFSRGAPSPLPEPALQYADYGEWQRAWLAGGVLEEQLGWWRERLAGAPPLLELPTDRPRPARAGSAGDSRPIRLAPETLRALADLSQGEGATLFMTVLAAFAVLLGRYAGQDDVVVGTPVAGRSRLEVENVVGFFVNMLALRTDLSGDPSFRAL